MIDLFFLTIVMTSELSNLNNVISEKKADRSPLTIIRSQWDAELCLMLLRCLSSSSCGAVAVSKQKHMSSTNKRIHLSMTSHMLPQSKTNEVTHGNQVPQVKNLQWQHVEPLVPFKVKLEIVFIHQGLIGLGKQVVILLVIVFLL